jgi:hypothetical protein
MRDENQNHNPNMPVGATAPRAEAVVTNQPSGGRGHVYNADGSMMK